MERVERFLTGEFAEPGCGVRRFVHGGGRSTDGIASSTRWLGTGPARSTATRQA